ncbi:MAG TPA: rhomboid family intramembrane serine protease, partial [Pontiella sp.]
IGSMTGVSPAVKFLLILNVSVFLLESLFPLSGLFALPAHWWLSFSFGQLFTYMFVHAGFNHLLVNMLGLFFLGSSVERTIGSFRFFILYYASGILGGLGWSLLSPEGTYCIGASGAVMGILGAFGALYPSAKLLLWFIIPVRAWVLVLFLAVWELSEMIGQPKIGGIANAAHLMGGVAGFCYAFALKHPHIITAVKEKRSVFSRKKDTSKASGSVFGNERLSKDEIDHILDKIGKEGMGALTLRERELLKRATRS